MMWEPPMLLSNTSQHENGLMSPCWEEKGCWALQWAVEGVRNPQKPSSDPSSFDGNIIRDNSNKRLLWDPSAAYES